MNEGRTLNQHSDPIKRAWINLFICITTDDVNAFYMALAGHVPRNSESHATWDEVNKTKPPRIRRPRNDKRARQIL